MFAVIVGFVGILWGTITDIRYREVPDWVNFSMLIAGIALAAGTSVNAFIGGSDWLFPILSSVAGALVGYGFGAAMYYTGQWGGGDAKMMLGLGALIGIPFTFAWTEIPFFISFIVISMLAGALYGFVWMIVLAIKHRKKVFPAVVKRLHDPKMMKWRIIVIVIAVLLVALALFLPPYARIIFLVLAAITYVLLYMYIAVKVIEDVCFVQKRAVNKLVLGDWIVKEVRVKGKSIIKPNNVGLTQEQLDALKKHNIKTVTIKEGIPFVPSFLIAYIACYVLYAVVDVVSPLALLL